MYEATGRLLHMLKAKKITDNEFTLLTTLFERKYSKLFFIMTILELGKINTKDAVEMLQKL